MQDLMKGKRGLIMGIANDHSIAWGIARTLAAQGGLCRAGGSGEGEGGWCIRNGSEQETSLKANHWMSCSAKAGHPVRRGFEV